MPPGVHAGERMTNLLEARSLVAGWGRRPVLRSVSLRVARGERVGVLGPNGAGKTTLFDVLAGGLRPRGGTVTLDGTPLDGLPKHRVARAGLGYVPQTPSVFPELSARRNLEVVVGAPAARGPIAPSDIREALRCWGLERVAEVAAGALSGGERRRLEVARTLLLRPRVLLLDEPFAGLDPRGREALRQGLRGVEPSTAIVVTDHAADDVLAVCDRIVVLIDGAIVSDGAREGFDPEDPAHRRYFRA